MKPFVETRSNCWKLKNPPSRIIGQKSQQQLCFSFDLYNCEKFLKISLHKGEEVSLILTSKIKNQNHKTLKYVCKWTPNNENVILWDTFPTFDHIIF